MTFDEVLDQVRELLQQRGRVSYRCAETALRPGRRVSGRPESENSSRPNGWRWMKTARCWSGRASSDRCRVESRQSRRVRPDFILRL